MRQNWTVHRADERPVESYSPHGRYSLALAYANTYHLGMSSLALQRLYALVHQEDDWSCERFFSDGSGEPRSVELDTPLSTFGAIAFSISFEGDYVNLLQMLGRSGIPLRRRQRSARDPVIIVGGACAAINPLPLAEFVDIFALGAAENLLPELLPALAEEDRREAVLERLAAKPGFFVPEHHDPEATRDRGQVFQKLAKLELSEAQMREPGNLPTTAIVTPHTEFADKFLLEMSRGCPEKCKYCWATFGMGRFRWHPTEFILGALDRARAVTDQLGFVATAVGDHPDLETILSSANERGFRTSVSSVRIPAVNENVLAALAASGDRSITLAPETGSDELRIRLNKPVPNSMLFDKVRLIFGAGFTQLKLYFIIGLPGETDQDIDAILMVARRCRAIMLQELAPSGVIGNIHLGVNILIPKPYTGYQRETVEDPAVLKRKLAVLRSGARKIPNVSIGTMSVRDAIWQAYITKAGSDAADVLERAAEGVGTAALLREFRERIEAEVFERKAAGERLRWHFLRAG
ncbi:MAG: radical SAM protein [Acidobacteria bacterium]|nr:radical SAM protein [Acidobacteriota bacterium]